MRVGVKMSIFNLFFVTKCHLVNFCSEMRNRVNVVVFLPFCRHKNRVWSVK